MKVQARLFGLPSVALFAVAHLGLAGTLALHAQQVALPLWPHQLPEPPTTTEPETDVNAAQPPSAGGHHPVRVTNVTAPTITVFPPHANVDNTGAAALVFPGGAYLRLAMDIEGADVCRWLNSLGMTCLLVKYRVPETGRYPENPANLEDAQQAMRLARQHAAEWHLNPHRIGVIGFSAGGNLAALLSTHPDDTHVLSTPAAPDVDPNIDARANFAILGYPAYLVLPSGSKNAPQGRDAPVFPTLNATYTPNQFTPPTFLVAAENDLGYGRNAPAYYEALAAASIPAQLIMYPTGGHGFGMFPPETSAPAHWSDLAAAWLRSLGVLGVKPSGSDASGDAPGTSVASPCLTHPPSQQARPGRPDTHSTNPQSSDPNCP